VKAFVARGVTLGLETSVESHYTLGSQRLIMPVVLSAPTKCERISGAIETSSVLFYIK
jgi:hypothetical protein